MIIKQASESRSPLQQVPAVERLTGVLTNLAGILCNRSVGFVPRRLRCSFASAATALRRLAFAACTSSYIRSVGFVPRRLRCSFASAATALRRLAFAACTSSYIRSVGFVPRRLRCSFAPAATAPRRLAFAAGSRSKELLLNLVSEGKVYPIFQRRVREKPKLDERRRIRLAQILL